MSDESSLTSVDSESDETYGSRTTKGPKKKTWTLRHVLRAPRTAQYSARTLYEEIVNGKVDLDPVYQRDVIWPETKQIGLIDSILRNYYIPPVIFAFSQTDDGEERRVCIDGKQRLTSIQRFMDGEIPYKDPTSNARFWFKLQPGSTGKVLPEQYRNQFVNKQIVCMEYMDITEDSEREIFRRVQLGVALTPAERMLAISGPWSELVRNVLTEVNNYKIPELLDLSAMRGRDFQCVAAAIYYMEKGNTAHPASVALEKWLHRTTPPTQSFKGMVLDAFAVFRNMVLSQEFESTFQYPTRLAPIEYIMCLVLVQKHMSTLTLTQLNAAIKMMREDVRSKHVDIRQNSKVTRTMTTFIYQDLPKNLKKSEPQEKAALSIVRSSPAPIPYGKAKRKRKRSNSDNVASPGESSSEDEMPLNMKMKTSTKGTAFPPDVDQTTAVSVSPAKDGIPERKGHVSAPTRVDRLASIRAAKMRADSRSPSSKPTLPVTETSLHGGPSSARQMPTPRSQSEVSSGPSISGADHISATMPGVDLDVLASILNKTSPSNPQQQQWPGQSCFPPMQTSAVPGPPVLQPAPGTYFNPSVSRVGNIPLTNKSAASPEDNTTSTNVRQNVYQGTPSSQASGSYIPARPTAAPYQITGGSAGSGGTSRPSMSPISRSRSGTCDSRDTSDWNNAPMGSRQMPDPRLQSAYMRHPNGQDHQEKLKGQSTYGGRDRGWSGHHNMSTGR